ncbi:ECF RNA polymerase sigma factor SigM [Alicyclobacillus acidoterrestris]|uniref:RNA polymerase sigma factor n=1 Tax=Alicyclobacillus suci TaxID=2816080 RepID=UPI001192A0BD|nr:sigma-70 family RNA polymerase sigma factor [Alicyclobacillus suci]GEO25906.1 ECF RNA polymerase sigma factor SigM [Alicyclobacillus acidoterrestris]
MDSAIARLFDEFADDIYSFLVYYTGTRDVDDLVQETFIKALRGLSKFEGRSSPKTWLLHIAKNVAVDHYRKSRRHEFVADDLLRDVDSGQRTPEELAELKDSRDSILQLLSQLKPIYREVILCRTVMDMTVEETARALNCSGNRVRVIFHRAIKAARGLSNEVLE